MNTKIKGIRTFVMVMSVTLVIVLMPTQLFADVNTNDTSNTSSTSNVAISNQVSQDVTNAVQDANEDIDVNNSGVEYTKKDIKDLCNDIDIEKLNQYYKTINREPVTREELENSFIVNINKVNKEIKNGDLDVLKNGTIVDNNDNNYYLQGGSTYDVRHWWGMRRYKSTKDANTWAYHLGQVSAANAGVSLLAGAAFGGVGALPNGITAIYLLTLSNKVYYVNGLSKRGIRADVYWVLVYSVVKQ